MAWPIVNALRTCAILLLVLTTGCLGGGGGGSSSQQSLGSVKYLGHTVESYDSLVAKIKAKGSLNILGVTDLNEIRIFTDSQCLLNQVGFGIHQDFAQDGIEVTLASANITDLYVSTNTSESCYYYFQYVPKYDAPPAPALGAISPASPSRTTYRPYISGDVSPATMTLRFFLDSACTISAGTGTAVQFESTGIQLTLQPDADNEIYGMALDAFGKSSDCNFLTRFLHDSNGATAPSYLSTSPVSPSGASTTPLIKGTAAADIQTVSIFTDATCTTTAGSGTAEDFRTTGIQAAVAQNASTSFYGIAIDDKMVPSDCTFLTIFTHDSVAPSAPNFGAVTPASPSRTTLVPRIMGTASSDTQQIRLFNNPTCTTMIGSGTKSVFEGAGIPAGVQANEVTTIYGVALDAAGNLSTCTQLTSFEHDTIAPDPPVFGLSIPASPNNQSITPRIEGTTDVSAVNVRIYNNETCTNLIGSGSTMQFESPGIQVTVTGNTTTTLYGTSDDAAGNTSECAALSNYSHSTVPAPAPGFFQSTPSSPTRITNRPYIIGTAASTITKVTLYSDASCTGSLGSASRSVFVTSGIQATVALNSQSSIYAISEDVYGNVSACTFMTNYIHNTIPPLNPIIASVTPLSPNNQSTTPIIKGSLVFDPGNILQPNEVSLYDGPICLNKIGTGTPAQFQGAGLTASLPPNTASFVYGRVFDAAGNSSDCTLLTDYTHDALVPGRPMLSAITPATPSFSSQTVMVGTVGSTLDFLAPTNLVVYSDSSCQTVLKSAPVSSFTAGTFDLALAKNTTTTLYGAIFNPVGTASPCTLLVNYVHSDIGPSGLGSTQSLDGSVMLNWMPDTNARPVPTYEIRRSIQSGGPYTTIADGIVGTTYTDRAVSNSQTYYYVVAARNNTGVTKNSAEIAHTVTANMPNQLLGLTALPGPTQVSLSWIGSSENMTYAIRRSNNPGGPYSTIASGLSTTTYVDRFLTNGTTYYYVVTGANPAGKSIDSNQASATPLVVPDAPTNLQLTQISNAAECGGASGVRLTWTPTKYYSSFTVNRGATSAAGTPFHSTTATSWVDCSPTDGSTPDYNYYFITANWGSLQSADSNKVVFANDGSGNLTVHPGNGLIQISWNSVGAASQYRLYRATTSGGPYSLITTTGSTSYVDGAVVNSQAYFYVMQAEYPNDAALGWATPEQGGIPGSNPEAPSNLVVTVNSNRHPVLSWSNPHAFNFFRVYRSPNAGGPYSLVGTSNANSYTDITPNIGWNFYRVVRVWGTSESTPTNTAQVRIGFPSTVNISSNTSSINLNWSSVSGAADYRILRSLSSGGPYTEINAVAGTSYSDTSALLNTGYYYVILPTFADLSVGQYSNEVSGALSNSTIPTGLTVISTTQSSVNLNWPRISGATSYKVYRSSTVNGTYLLVGQQASVGMNVTGLSGLTEHFFKFSFVRGGIESVASAATSAFTWSSPSAPVVTAGNNSIGLGWGTVSGVSTYSVLRSLDGENFSSIASGLTLPEYTDASALNAQLYFYRIVAHFPTGDTRTSPTSTAVTPGIIPRAPTNLSITKNIDGSDIELSWGPSAGAAFYRIYRSTSSGGPYTQVSQTSNYQNNVVTGHAAGTKYFFVVTAVIGSLESSYSNETAVIPLAAPNAPLASVDTTTINVSWGAVVGASQYYLLRSTDRSNFTVVAGPMAATSYADTSALTGYSYSYRFQPVDAASTPFALSLISADVTLGILPETPANLVGFNSSTNSVALSWTQVPNILDYVILRSTTSGGPYTQIASTSSLAYLDTGLAPGTTYHYVLSSRDFSGNLSPYSNQVSIRLNSQPANLIANAVPDSIQLSWSAVPGTTGYSLYRAQTSGGPYGRIAQNIAATNFQDTNIQDGVTFYYIVRAEFGSELSLQSAEASAVAIRRVNLQVPIELVDQSLSSDTATQTFDRTLTSLNTNLYDGTVTYEFEVAATNSDSSARQVRIVNQSNTVVGTIVVPASSLERRRLRTTFTPTAGDDRYRVQLEATTVSGQLEIATARLLVTQTGASRTAIYIPLLSSSAGAFIGDEDGPIITTSNTTFEFMPSASIFTKESSKYSELISQNPWRLETLVSATGDVVGAVALYNNTRNGHVDDTESLFSGPSIQLSIAPFQEGVTGFASNNELDKYQVVVRCVAECGTGQARLYKAGLWVYLNNLDKARIVFRNGLGADPSALTHYDQQRTLIDLSRFSNPVTYFQATATLISGMTSGLIWLSDLGLNDSGLGTPNQVSNSALAINSNTKSSYLSPAVNLTTGNRYIPSADPNGSMLQMTDSAIVIDISN